MSVLPWNREWLGEVGWYLGMSNGIVFATFLLSPSTVTPAAAILYLGLMMVLWKSVVAVTFVFDQRVQRRFPAQGETGENGRPVSPFLVSLVWTALVTLGTVALIEQPADAPGAIILVSTVGNLVVLGGCLAVIARNAGDDQSDDDESGGYSADRGYW